VAQDDGQQTEQPQQQQQQPEQPQQQQPDPMVKDQETAKPKRKVPPFAIIGVVALLVIVGGLFYWHSTYYEDHVGRCRRGPDRAGGTAAGRN